YQPDWAYVQPDTLEATMRYSEAIGNKRIGVASAPVKALSERRTLEEVIQHLNWVHEQATRANMEIGYHAHKTDFAVVDGKTVWDRIFENTPESFAMILDTGNALAGGVWSVPLLEKFPGRSPWVHLKPFSLKDLGATMIGDDDFDWPSLLKACVELGGADTLTVEYSNNDRYEPMTAVRMCIERLRAYME
ncbi:MAG: TIM barrel protein, partial [Clostridia bacterium]